MNKKLLMGIIAGIGVVALVLGLVLGLNNCTGTTDPTVEPTPSGTAEPTDPTEKPTRPPKETEGPTDPPEPGGISYYSGMPDFNWYDADEIYEEYTLYTADQFMAFAELVNGMGVNFQNVTIKLGANMVLNNGDASTWTRDDVELLKWTPIGSKEANAFAGTLDGQGHYISGLYGVKARDNGFMLYTKKATIQNLAIVNSYFCNTGGDQAKAQVLGGVVGRGYGVTLKNIYCDAILEGGGYHTGGIVAFARDTWTLSKMDDAKDVLIDSCVFAGTIKGAVGTNVGGIIGGTDGQNVKLITNCLNLGSIESAKASVGGIAGAISKETVITNCVNAGKVVSAEEKADRVALVGNAASSATVDNCYFASVPGAKPFGSGSPSSTGVRGAERASMKGGNAPKAMTALDFGKTWTAYKDGYPIPAGVTKMFDALKKTVVEDAGNGGPVYKNPVGSTDTGNADISWYKEGEKTFTLTTADQLYGLAKLVNDGKTTFEGVTIKLGANIIVNAGDCYKWDAETTGLRLWKTMGTSASKYFAGTLDGQGHYISGLYVRAERDSGFMCYAMNATVKNLAIINSYFENYGRAHANGYLSAQVLGTFVGRGYGVTLKNLYSDARILIPETAVSFNTGGIAGFAKSEGKQGDVEYGASLIESCVFAGTITTNNEADSLTGGILGSTDGSYATIKNCLNRGQISSKGKTFAGIAGKLDKQSVMEGCVNVGNVDSKVGLVGTVASTVEVRNCYYAKLTGSKAYGGGAPKTNKIAALTRDQMKGLEVGTAMSGLDFKSAWTALKDDYPIPTGVKNMYAAHKQPIPGGEEDKGGSDGPAHEAGTPDTSWYEDGKTEFTLTTADQLYGLAQLVNDGTNFQGVTIKLGADIVINEGDASKWDAKTTGLRAWKAIGSSASKYFAGTLDGQGHYISGLYVRADRDNGFICYAINATVKNLAIINSYFENYGREHASGYLSAQVLGTFVGRSYGSTLQNLYTDARLVIPETAVSFNTGGIAGFAKSEGKQSDVEYGASLIESCVFAGTITTNNEKDDLTGGILGSTDGSYTTIKNCLNRGQISSKGKNFAGIAGKLDKQSVMEGCVNVGNVDSKVGLLGTVTGTVEVSNCYYVKMGGGKAYSSGTPKTNKVTALTRDQMKGLEIGTAMSGLDFKVAWTALEGDYPIPTGVKEMYAAHKQPIPGGEAGGESGGEDDGPSHEPGTPDTNWYIEGETSFTLTTADQLYGLAQLVNDGTSFQGVTIKLGADIVINEGDASKWDAKTTGLRAWTPIGLWGKGYFSGTLDGQGHYISGIFGVRGRDNGFMCATINATIQNLAIINSYFENEGTNNSAQVLGTFVGRSYGSTLQNLYTDARLVVSESAVGYNTGGIAGFAKSEGKQSDVEYGASLIESCVFAGTITTNNEADNLTGGILGSTDGSYTTIKNCLNRGQISSKGKNFAGIAGKLDKQSVMEGCVNVGNVDSKVGLIGTVTGTVEVNNCYYVKMAGGRAYGSGTPKANKITALTRDQMKGLEIGTAMSGLDFKSAWTALKDDYPIPTGVKEMYAAHKQPIPGGEAGGESGGESGGEDDGPSHEPGTPDTNWYIEGETSFTLTTADQLYGLAQLVNEGVSFQGVTIKLGADIVINEGDASKWDAKTTGLRAWTPIGLWGKGYFSGTLDGQGHYISGIFSVRGRDNGFMCATINATIQNLAIINSYFENEGTNNSSQVLGAFVGRGYGVTLKNLYTNAILVSSNVDYHTGGIIAFAKSKGTQSEIEYGESTIDSVVFAGTINSVTGNAGSLVGGIMGGTDGSYAFVKNCLFVGTIDANDNYVAGIVGRISKGSEISDCVSVGIIKKEENKTAGAIVGELSGDGSFTISDCYYTEDLGFKLYGKKSNSSSSLTSTGNEELKASEIFGLTVKDDMPGLDFTSAWTAQENDYPVPTGVKEMYLANKKPHVHDWMDAWTSDEEYHWHNCGNIGCDVTDTAEKPGYGKHVFAGEKDRDCETCGYIRTLPDANDGAAFGGVSEYSGYAGGDNSWYKPDSGITEYILDNADQLYGLAYLVNVKGVTFEGVTIKLGANMVINKGDASTWGTTPPENRWRPIGKDWANCFKGTIDGQGHYISGLYNVEESNNGFIYCSQNATIKNLAIINSYFENTGTGKNTAGEVLATFAGKGRGTYLLNLYSDAILVGGTQQIGGIASYIQGVNYTGARDGKVENCVFAGKINGGTTQNVGGILGADNNKGNNTVIRNCLFIGEVNSQAAKVGGIVGVAAENCVIDNCVSAGKVTVSGTNSGYTDANVVGSLSGSNVEITNCYYPEGTKLVGNENGKTYKSEGSKSQTDAKMKGTQVTDTMDTLKFGNKGWTARLGDYPVPTSMEIVVNALRKLTAPAEKPNIVVQPTMNNLTVHAESMDGGVLTYQWYMSTDGTTFAPIKDATGASYTHDPSITTVVWYYCEVTNTNNKTTNEIKSATVQTKSVKFHEHKFDTTMLSDKDGHWYKCTVEGCDVPVTELPSYSIHIFDSETDTICNVPECGYERHIHDWNPEWKFDDAHGWHNCDAANCDATKNEDKEGYHAHAFETTGGIIKCVTCGYVRKVSVFTGTEDYSWFTEEAQAANEYHLISADQLWSFEKKVNSGTNFKGATVYLDVDIIFNESDASTWGSNAPSNSWTPIGAGWSTCFMGTIDGQGHYISGLYSVQTLNNGFIYCSQNATIKNLAIINSYFENTGTGKNTAGEVLATFAGKGRGTYLLNLYSDAILVGGTQQIGGIASYIQSINYTDPRNGKIENCVFAGTINGGTAQNVGGILGSDNNAGNETVIRNCLFIGEVNSQAAKVGGIVGVIQKNCVVDNCVSAGKVTVTGANASYTDSNVVGFVAGENTKITNCYHPEGTKLVGDENGQIYTSDGSKSQTHAKMKGEQVTTTMDTLTFGQEGWTAQEGDYPVPTAVKDMVNALRKLSADAEAPNIITQPTMDNMTVEAESMDGGKLSYQWYMSTDGVNFEAIVGATDATYTHDPSHTGNIWYYCEVTNTNNNTSGVTSVKLETNKVIIHEHNFDTSQPFEFDKVGHWHKCTVTGCDADVTTFPSYAQHSFDSETDPTCNVTGCAYERHIHNWNPAWVTDEYEGWHECDAADCDATDKTEKGSYHKHSFVIVNGVAECETCGYELTASKYDGTPDYSWYEENLTTKKVTLFHADQLFGLADIVNGTNGATQSTLEGWEIYLGVDMIINEGDASTWNKETTGLNTWIPIGTGAAKSFRGTLDGNYHSISGLYYTKDRDGGFICYALNATVKNLAIVNSYFEHTSATKTGQMLATFVGRAYGSKLENLYSNAILVNSALKNWCIGGIAGIAKSNSTEGGVAYGESYISNCVFAGQIRAVTEQNGEAVGGILGHTDGTYATVENCLFSGSIVTNAAGTGGIAGYINKSSVIRNCLAAGTIAKHPDASAGGSNGAIVGKLLTADTAYTLTGNYYSNRLNFSSIGGQASNATCSEEPVSVDHVNLLGENADAYLPNLDFTSAAPKWTTMNGDLPVPTGVLKLVEAVHKVSGNAKYPVIDKQPESAGYATSGDSVTALEITATSIDGGKLTYQWYENSILSNDGGMLIPNVTGSTYTPDISGMSAGETKFFYCVVTNTNSAVEGESTASVASAVAVVHIHKAKATWKYDETQHWHECKVDGCTELLGKENHDSNANHVCQCGQAEVSYYQGEAEDTSWLNEHAGTQTDPYQLDSGADLHGLRKLVNAGSTSTLDATFAGKYFVLTKNIVFNVGDASTWGTNAPSTNYSWTPIGNSESANYFAGNLDGQGHYISGLYYSIDRNGGFFLWTRNATIQNMAIINSYFRHKSASGNGQALATFVGRGDAVTLKNLYTDAILENTAKKSSDTQSTWFTGGIAAFAYKKNGSANAWIENCVFAGEIIETANGAGQGVGGIVGSDDSKGGVTIKNCLFSGKLSSNDSGVGGIIGQIGRAATTVENCVVAGEINRKVVTAGSKYPSSAAAGTNVDTWGAVAGIVATDCTIKNCYYDPNATDITNGSSPITLPLYGYNTTSNATDNAPVSRNNMKGEAAVTNMPKLFQGTPAAWKVTEGYPVPVGAGEMADEQDAFEGATVPFTINGNHISKYTIVWGDSHLTALKNHEWYNEVAGIAANRSHQDDFKQWLTNEDGSITEYNYETALRLQAYIEQVCSVKLDVKAESEVNSDYVILVDSEIWSGNALNYAPADADKYDIYVEGNKLIIKGGSYGATWHALDYLESMDSLVLPGNYEYAGSYDMITVGMVGDSITHGSNSSLYVWNGDQDPKISNNLNYTALTYPAQVARLMWKDVVTFNYGQAGIRVENYRNGDEWPILQANAPELDYVTIMLGTNDAGPEGFMKDGVWSAEEGELFFNEYKTIVETLQGLNSDLEFIMLTPPSCWRTSAFATANIHAVPAVESAYRELSKNHIIGFIDMHTLTAGMKDYFTDQLHPNNEGYVMFAKIFSQYIESVIMTDGLPSINARRPELTAQPSDCGFTAGAAATPLQVVATSRDGGHLSYQWFEVSSDTNVGGTPIPGATQADYTPDLSGMAAEEVKYFYCEITNTNNNKIGEKTASVVTEPVCVHIHKLADTITGHDATHHWAGCLVDGCTAADAKELHTGEGKTCSTCGFLKANYYAGGSDKTWYTENPNASEYVLTTPEELKGLAEIVNAGTDTFEGQTIKLGANMVFNMGNAEDKFQADVNAGTRHSWTPIGTAKAKHFAGTFNGQGHYISGLYSYAVENNALFAWTVNATFENLSIINSYFDTPGRSSDAKGQMVGTFVARGLGATLRNLYSDAILSVAGQTKTFDWCTGGIVGVATSPSNGNTSEIQESTLTIKNKATIENCVFAGSILTSEGGTDGRYVGGILGYSNGKPVTIKNCLFSGKIESNDKEVGGIAGGIHNYGLIESCVSAGTMTPSKEGLTYWDPIVGHIMSSTGTSVTNCYYSDAINMESSNGAKLTAAQMKGDAATTNMAALFAGQDPAWIVVTDGYPVPKNVLIP